MPKSRIAAKFVCLFLPMFLPWFAHGQDMSSTGSGSWGFSAISNFAPCSTGGVTCWHAMPGDGAYISSRNWKTIMVNSSNQAFTYNEFPTNTWTQQAAWGSVYEVQLAGDGNYYALMPNSAKCANGLAEFARWDASTSSWTDLPQTCPEFHSLSVAADGGGQFLSIKWDGTPFISTNYGSSWTDIPGTKVLSVSSYDSTNGVWVAVKSDHTVWEVTGSTWTQILGVTNASTVDVDENGVIYVLGTDGFVYHYSGSGSAWDKLNGSGNTAIANSGSMNVWSVGTLAGGANVYRFSDTGVHFSRNYHGQVNCTPPPPFNQSVCNAFTHTASLQIEATGKTGALTQQQWLAAGDWALTATVDVNDSFDCFIGAGCAPTETQGQMQCSSGANNTDTPPKFITETAFTMFEVPLNGETKLTSTRSRYELSEYCIPADSPPDFTAAMLPGPPAGTYTFLPFREGFALGMILFSLNGGSTWAPLPTLKPIYVEDYTILPGLQPCTKY